jgi:hypothetical protein
MNIHSVGAQLCHVDSWTEGHDEANSRFSNFLKALKNINKSTENKIATVITRENIMMAFNMKQENSLLFANDGALFNLIPPHFDTYMDKCCPQTSS